MDINEFAKEVHENAVAHGWWDEERSILEIVALIHSEWSEALEEYRDGRPMVWYACEEAAQGDLLICEPHDTYDCRMYGNETQCPHRSKKPEGIAVELADGCIRILDFMEKMKSKLAQTLDECIENVPDVVRSVSLPDLVAILHYETSKGTKSVLKPNIVPFAEGIVGLANAFCISCAWIKDMGADPIKIIREKHEYNKTRAYKHGGKIC